jgi:AcrR family transcriptional regulator
MTTAESDGTLGRRERKKLATRRAITAAALRLIAERGFDNVTIEQISEAADVAPRTFFNYFSCKEDAVIGAVEERRAALQAAVLLDDGPDDHPLEILHRALRASVTQAAESPEDLVRRQQIIHGHPALLARHLAAYGPLEQMLTELIAERIGADAVTDLYPRVTAAAAAAAVRGAVSHWIAIDGGTPLGDLVDQAFDHLRDGLALPAPPARQET